MSIEVWTLWLREGRRSVPLTCRIATSVLQQPRFWVFQPCFFLQQPLLLSLLTSCALHAAVANCMPLAAIPKRPASSVFAATCWSLGPFSCQGCSAASLAYSGGPALRRWTPPQPPDLNSRS